MLSLHRRFVRLILAAAGLLLLPFIAMQFSTAVRWSVFDFIVAGIILFGTAITIEIIFRKLKSRKSRIVWISIVLFIILIAWAELAVGVFGTRLAGS